MANYIDNSLSNNENVVSRFQLSWVVWIKPVIYSLTIILLPKALFEMLRLKSIEMGVTNKRLVHKWGIIRRESDEMRLVSLETVEINQGIWGRILGFGDLEITGRGASSLNFRFIKNPVEAKRIIESVSVYEDSDES